ncbi:MAG: thiamine-phosphate kinase [Oscillospiraceae bacterium]|nr:thiamine-phosphate kinase [Oscillospiraceae bacterium]
MILADIGERKIIDNIIMEIFPDLRNFDDDCAVIDANLSELLVSTDPAPEPIAFKFGFTDYYYYGWLLVVVNVSDIAAMGGEPIGILVSSEMQPTMNVRDYTRFLFGVRDACAYWKCPLVGGNIKDGSKFIANGTVLGKNGRHVLRRHGAVVGDLICVLGNMGMFWTSVITHHHNDNNFLTDDEKSLLFTALTRPKAKLEEGKLLSESGLVTSCTDCSDGITWNLISMAKGQSVDFILEADKLNPMEIVKKVCSGYGYDVKNVMMSSGDYNLVFTVSPVDYSIIRDKISGSNTTLSVIGHVTKGNGCAKYLENSNIYDLNDISSERFCQSSTFTHGYEAYLSILKDSPLFADARK